MYEYINYDADNFFNKLEYVRTSLDDIDDMLILDMAKITIFNPLKT